MLIPRKYRTLAAIIFCAVLAYIVGLEASLFPTADVCEPNPYNHGAEECAAHYIVHVPFIYAAHFLDAEAGLITALATIAIGIFTYTLYTASVEQAGLTRDSIKVATDAARAAEKSADALPAIERAYLFMIPQGDNFANVVSVVLGEQIYPNPPHVPELRFSFENAGKTPAMIKEVRYKLEVIAGLPAEDDYPLVSPMPCDPLVAANVTLAPIKIDSGRLDATKAAQIKAEHAWIWFWGSVLYDTMFEKNKVTYFCWRYDAPNRRLTQFGEKENRHT